MTLWASWTLEPGVIIPLAIATFLYARGAHPKRGVTRLQTICFWSGLAILGIALLSPLHPLGEVLFSAHMTQHEILMLVAAPLLVLARPLAPLLWGVPPALRRAVAAVGRTQAWRHTWHLVTAPLVAWLIHAAVLWLWHAPSLFQATLDDARVHFLQHASFFGSALLFWWAVLHEPRGVMSYGLGVLYLFTT